MGMIRALDKCRRWAGAKWTTSYRLNAIRTGIYGYANRIRPTRLALVMGCQRSGTTMLANAIGLSPHVKDYGEGDPKYFYWADAPRLRPLDEVAAQLNREHNCVTLLKPLCDSQRAEEILHRFPSARGFWIVRNFRDCVASHVQYYSQFHDGLAYVREMLQLDSPTWKNEGLSGEMRDVLASASTRELNLETAYALYWLARNSIFDALPKNVAVTLIHYEDILRNPEKSLEPLFGQLSIPFRPQYALAVSPPARRPRQGRSPIDDDVAERCERLHDRLRRR
jgi:hypothetical protein